MSFSKARYITVCQQVLVAAAVSAVGLSTAGVMTLEIVSPQQQTPSQAGLAPAVKIEKGLVETRPVTPTVRSVSLTAGSGQDTEPPPPAGAQAGSDAASAPAARSGKAEEAPPTAPRRTGEQKDQQQSQSQAQEPDRKGAGQQDTDQGAGRGADAPDTVQGRPVVVTSDPQPVTGYATVGVTWDPGTDLGEDDIALQVRTRTQGTWSEWTELDYHDDHGPDSDDAGDAGSRPGTDPLVIGRVGQVQMRAETASGTLPAGLRLDLVDPGKDRLTEQAPAIDTGRIPASDESSTGAPIEDTADLPDPATSATEPTAGAPIGATSGGAGEGDIALTATKIAPKPQIYSRAQWGANEKLREKGNPDYGTIKTGFVHHTVNSNDYKKADVPALLRGIYAYHVVSRGWRDIGYNFLVDRFGRIWEGRYGGVDRPVVGAHTLGYNEVSFAMSAIGNFDIAQPPQAVVDAYKRLFAWKLSLYGISATASKRKVKGATLHAINGHRDVGQTACPGRYLYAKLGEIRKGAKAIQDGGTPPPTTPPPAPVKGYNPLQALKPATAQPGTVQFPAARNLVNDGWPDLVLQAPDGSVSLLPTGGMVGYRGAIRSKGDWKRMSKIVAVGDVTGDGRGDVLSRVKKKYRHQRGKAAKIDQGWRLHAGKANGQIRFKRYDDRVRLRAYRTLVYAGDWNRDGRADLLGVHARTGALYLLTGKAKPGRFKKGRKLAKDWSAFTHTVVTADLNRDGRRDVVALARNNRLYVALGQPGGKIGPPVAQRKLGKHATGLTGGGDLTGDGVGDVTYLQRKTRRTMVLRGNGKGGFARPYGPFKLGKMHSPSGAPMAGGVRADIVGRVGKHLVTRVNNEQVNLRGLVSTGLVTGAATGILSLGDWNGDGYADIATREEGGDRLMLYLGRPGGRFAPGTGMGKGPGRGWKSFARLTAVGDVTGDGKPDLMGQPAGGAMRIFPGNGKQGFKPPVAVPATMRTFNAVGGTSWRPGAGPASVLASSGNTFVPYAGPGATSAMRAAGIASLAAYDWILGLGDVNGDRRPDLLVRKRSNGSLWLIPGTATGFGTPQYVGGGLGKYRIAD